MNDHEERIRQLEKEVYKLHRDTAIILFFWLLTAINVLCLILR